MGQEATFIHLILVAYIMSVGFGMIVAQGKGVKWVNRQWRVAITGTVRIVLNATARLLRSVARRIR